MNVKDRVMGLPDDIMQMKVLTVEDNPGDVRLIREMLKTSKIMVDLRVAMDGQEALDMLRADEEAGTLPNLIILDLNLPRKDGRELLVDIKKDPRLKRIPVVIFTSSSAEQDILQSYDLHANCYITKQVQLDEFYKAVKAIQDFWLKVVTLPSSSADAGEAV
jgi:two-component system, chemotaxis family, response regulator Rcp1